MKNATISSVLLSLLLAASVSAAQAAARAEAPAGEPAVYKKVDGRELKLYVLKPGDRRPAVVFFHGGGWVGGTPSQFNVLSRHLASRGMVCVQVEYRLLDGKSKERAHRLLSRCQVGHALGASARCSAWDRPAAHRRRRRLGGRASCGVRRDGRCLG